MRLRLAYDGPEGAPFEVDDEALLGEFAPRAGAEADEEHLLRSALEHPLGSEPLRERARGARSVLLLVDDATRGTPVARILPHVDRELQAAGVADASVTVLVAQGTHRRMTEAELREKIGPAFLGRWRVVQHDHLDEAQLERLGETSSGMPVVVHRLVTQSDLCVGIGHVGIHGIMGYSGGAKIVFPGASGAAPERYTHWRAASDFEPGMLMGRRETPMRLAIEEAAHVAGLDVVVNVAMDRAGRVQGAAFGDFVEAQRALTGLVERLYAVEVPQADVVVVEAKPADRDYWQSIKGLYAATLVARERGRIVLVAPNHEGVAATHPELLRLAALESEEIRRRVDAGEVEDVIAAAVALFTARIRERSGVTLVSSGISAADAERLGFRAAPTVDAALASAQQELPADARVVVLRGGGGILPVVRGRNAHLFSTRGGPEATRAPGRT